MSHGEQYYKSNRIFLSFALILVIFYIIFYKLTIGPKIYIIPNTTVAKVTYVNNGKQSPIQCFRTTGPSLPDILDSDPPRGKSVFFLETSCKSSELGKIVVNARQACAVESAAKMNTNLLIHLVFASPGLIKKDDAAGDRLLEVLLSYDNVKILHLNYERYVEGTPIQDLYSSGKIAKSKHVIAHASDLLRLLTLYKYGGIYMDLDVIVTKPLEALPKNFAGMQSQSEIANGIMGFDFEGKGHEHVNQCLLEAQKTFNGEAWSWNGPELIQRIVTRLCGRSITLETHNKTCEEFTILPTEYFYSIPYPQWRRFFDAKDADYVMDKIKNSYSVHVWNKLSAGKNVTKQSNMPYELLAKKFCPKVYDASGLYF